MDGWLGVFNDCHLCTDPSPYYIIGLFTNDVVNLKHQGAGQKLMIGWHKHQGVSGTPKNADVICEQPLMGKILLVTLNCELRQPWTWEDGNDKPNYPWELSSYLMYLILNSLIWCVLSGNVQVQNGLQVNIFEIDNDKISNTFWTGPISNMAHSLYSISTFNLDSYYLIVIWDLFEEPKWWNIMCNESCGCHDTCQCRHQ